MFILSSCLLRRCLPLQAKYIASNTNVGILPNNQTKIIWKMKPTFTPSDGAIILRGYRRPKRNAMQDLLPSVPRWICPVPAVLPRRCRRKYLLHRWCPQDVLWGRLRGRRHASFSAGSRQVPVSPWPEKHRIPSAACRPLPPYSAFAAGYSVHSKR